jgi:hypothetical protein
LDPSTLKASLDLIAKNIIEALLKTKSAANRITSSTNEVKQLKNLQQLVSNRQERIMLINKGAIFAEALVDNNISQLHSQIDKKYSISKETISAIIYITAAILELLINTLSPSKTEREILFDRIRKESISLRAYKQAKLPLFSFFNAPMLWV